MKEKTEFNGKCFICGCSNILHIKTRNPKYWTEYGSDIFLDRKIYFCKKCSFSFSYPFVSKEDLGKFYSNDFLRRHKQWQEYELEQYKKGFLCVEGFLKLILQMQHINTNQISKVIEIGGTGIVLKTWKDYIGQENIEYYSLQAPGVYSDFFEKEGFSVVDNDITGNDLIDNTTFDFDIVLSNHVLEHFNANDLNNVVENIYKMLRDGGLFIFDVPCDDFKDFLESGIRNQGCHLSHFTENSLSILLQKHGFDILYISRTGIDSNQKPDNYPYLEESPPINYHHPEKILWWDVGKKHNQKIRKFLLRKMPTMIRENAASIRDYLYIFLGKNTRKKKPTSIKDIISTNILSHNANGNNLRVCCRKG
jgi:SAM-dependent methyltransferase